MHSCMSVVRIHSDVGLHISGVQDKMADLSQEMGDLLASAEEAEVCGNNSFISAACSM